jgi:sporulation protein YlmC with PRC-barrel domain
MDALPTEQGHGDVAPPVPIRQHDSFIARCRDDGMGPALGPTRVREPVVVSVSSLLGRSVHDTDGTFCGRVRDVVARVEGARLPRVVALLIWHRRAEWRVPIECIDQVAEHCPVLVVGAVAYVPAGRRAAEIRLGHDILDRLAVDLTRPDVVKVSDVLLESRSGNWLVVGISWGAPFLLRRLFPAALRRPAPHAHFLRWADLELFVTDIPDSVLTPDHQRLACLPADDIARVADAVPPSQTSEILASLYDDLAADVLARLTDERQAQVVTELGAERASRILASMAPDAVAQFVGALEPETADELLRHTAADTPADLHALPTYPKDTADGPATTD